MDFPPELDAAKAAPEYHRLALENESVRVFETKIMPGETVPVHTHCWPSANYFFSFSDFIRRDEMGAVLVDSKAMGISIQPGEAHWSAPLPPHTLENVGDKPIHLVSVEVKPVP